MPRHDHGQIPGLVIQPGRTLVLKQDGSASGQVEYRCDARSAFSLAPGIGSVHPDNSHFGAAPENHSVCRVSLTG